MKHKEYKSRTVQKDWVTYKLNRIIPYDEEDNHHIISKRLKDRFKVWEPDNIVRIKRRTHVALNNLFENRQNPKEQLAMMFDIWKTALSTWVRQELWTILNLPDDMFYNENLINGRHKRSKGKENL